MRAQNLIVKERVDEGEFQTEQVLTISSGHFVHDVYSAFLAPLLPLLIEKMSLTLTLAGSLSAFMQLPAILTPFIGHLADKYNLRYLVIIAPALTATVMSAMGLAPNYATLALLLILAGISSALFHAPAPAMVGQISGKRVGKGMSWFMGGGELARTVGPLVAVWAVSLLGVGGHVPRGGDRLGDYSHPVLAFERYPHQRAKERQPAEHPAEIADACSCRCSSSLFFGCSWWCV